MTRPHSSEEPSFWSDLGPKEQFEIRSVMRVRRVARGSLLIEQDSPAETLYIVNFGLFDVNHAADKQPVAEIGAGQLIGDIGFFAGAARTAFVIAARDFEVLEINRDEFDNLTARVPEIHRAVTRALGKRLVRLASNVRDGEMAHPRSPLRMVAIVPPGSKNISSEFVRRLRKVISTRARDRPEAAGDRRGRPELHRRRLPRRDRI